MKFFLSLFIALTTTLAAEAQCSSGGCSSGGAGLFGRRAPATYYVPAVTYSYAQPTQAASVVTAPTTSGTTQLTVTTRPAIGHSHTCANGHTWDHASNPSHICQFPVGENGICGLEQRNQDSYPRPVMVVKKTYVPAVAIAKPKENCPECEAAAAKVKAEEAKSVAKEETPKREENTLPDGYKWFKDPDGKWQALKLKAAKEPEATVTTGTEVATTGWLKTDNGWQKIK